MDLSASERALGTSGSTEQAGAALSLVEDDAYLHLCVAHACRMRMDSMTAWGIEYVREHYQRGVAMDAARACIKVLDDAGVDPSELVHRMLDTEEQNP